MAVATALLATFASPPVAQALDVGVTATSSSTFRLLPGRKRVEVTVVLTLTNHIPAKVRSVPCRGAPSQRCQRLVETPVVGWPIVIQSRARKVRLSGRGATKQVHTRQKLLTVYVPEFKPIPRGEIGTIRVTYSLPATGPRSAGQTRVMDAYAHFCWYGQVTDRGTIKAILPPGFEPSTQQRGVRTKRSATRTVVRSKRTKNLENFAACTDFYDPSALVRAPRGAGWVRG